MTSLPPDAPERIDAALTWLRRSIAATGGRGSAHSYSPLWGWTAAYPETTGYLLPTLLFYAEKRNDPALLKTVGACYKWLIEQQLPCGAFPGGLVGSNRPSAFNTAMILFGLCIPVEKILAEEDKIRGIQSAQKALGWLLTLQEPDGAWRQAAYVPGFVPAYYSYAVWAAFQAADALERPEARAPMRQALRFYAKNFRADGTLDNWGLKPGPNAFTHTIGYALHGFLESALILEAPEVLDQCYQSAEGFLNEFERSGRVAGRYGAGWRGDYSFSCPTGNAQLSIFFQRLFQLTGRRRFQDIARQLLAGAAAAQALVGPPAVRGALPGSTPVWGPYLRFRYPNWGLKFFLDAVHLVKTMP